MAPRSSEDTILQAPKVWLSQETRDDLERFSRSRTLPASLVQRVQIILRAAVGQDTQQIAAALNLCRQTVGRWRERYMAEGQRGLEDRYRSGCHAQITAILAGEWNRSHWTLVQNKGTELLFSYVSCGFTAVF